MRCERRYAFCGAWCRPRTEPAVGAGVGTTTGTLTNVGQADTTNSRTVHFDARRTLSRRHDASRGRAGAGEPPDGTACHRRRPHSGEALRDQVAAAVDRLNYQPNLVASHFRRRDGRSFTVGLVLHDVANPFLAKTQAGRPGRGARTRPRHVGGKRGRHSRTRAGGRREAAGAKVEGLILMPAGEDHSYLQVDQRSGTAIVFLDQPPVFLAADSVLVDNRKGAAMGVRHLVRRGAPSGSRTWAIGNRPGPTGTVIVATVTPCVRAGWRSGLNWSARAWSRPRWRKRRQSSF